MVSVAEWQAFVGKGSSSSSSSAPPAARDRIAGLTVGSGEIAELDGKIQAFNSDVASQSKDPPFVLSVTDFVARWTTWRNAHVTFLEQSAVPVLGEPDVGREFQAFQSEFNEKLRLFTKAGGKTEITASGPEGGPLDKLANTIGDVVLYGGIALVAFLILSRTSTGPSMGYVRK